jgi:hypothetical protein
MATSLTEPVKTSNVFLRQILDFSRDIVISGTYSCFGSSASGGEGFCIYFTEATLTDTNNNVGSPGPGLGYTPSDGLVEFSTGTDIFSGVSNAICGIGFDIVGDFALAMGGLVDGDTVAHPNAITLRHGSTNNYSYISSGSPLSLYGVDIYDQYVGDTPPKRSFKIRLTNYGRKVLVYLKNSNTDAEFTKVFEQDNIIFDIPSSKQCHVGLSYSTGVNYSQFFLYNLSINGMYFETLT